MSCKTLVGQPKAKLHQTYSPVIFLSVFVYTRWESAIHHLLSGENYFGVVKVSRLQDLLSDEILSLLENTALKVITATTNVKLATENVITATLIVSSATKQVIAATLKVIYATTKLILATEFFITATLKVISATTRVISANKEVITITLNVISAITKVIMATKKLVSATGHQVVSGQDQLWGSNLVWSSMWTTGWHLYLLS